MVNIYQKFQKKTGKKIIEYNEKLNKLDVFETMDIEATNLKDCYILTLKRFSIELEEEKNETLRLK